MKNDRWTPNKQAENYRCGVGQKLHIPANEFEADKIIRRMSFSVKFRAFFYSLFWLSALPGIFGFLAALAYFLYNQDIVVALYCLGVVFSPLFFLKGLGGNAHKRLFVAHCLGLRGMKTALIVGWDGHQYLGDCTIDTSYATQLFVLRMYDYDK
ncbi:MAG: hypothetical protein PHD01_02015 [Geobacteraceae bacterium]|nr:hypothetical protein [Geobacteraceae bacterium]